MHHENGEKNKSGHKRDASTWNLHDDKYVIP